MADTLQIKLSMDQGLSNVWKYLTTRYEGLDKASIIRLAINNLAQEEKKNEPKSMLDILEETDALLPEGMTEEEAFAWWNENKKEILDK